MPLETVDEKRQFINELMTSLRDRVLSEVHRMPPEWNGHELRQYIVDITVDQVVVKKMGYTRMKAYRFEVINRDL